MTGYLCTREHLEMAMVKHYIGDVKLALTHVLIDLRPEGHLQMINDQLYLIAPLSELFAIPSLALKFGHTVEVRAPIQISAWYTKPSQCCPEAMSFLRAYADLFGSRYEEGGRLFLNYDDVKRCYNGARSICEQELPTFDTGLQEIFGSHYELYRDTVMSVPPEQLMIY